MPTKPRYWGGDPSTQGMYDMYWARDQEQAKKASDLEYFDRYGYFPNQRADVEGAIGAGQEEWDQILADFQGAIGAMESDQMAQQIRDYYSNVGAGRDLPFGEETLATLISRATDPLAAQAKQSLGATRESFAARGLGRSGGLADVERRILTDAATRGVSEASDLRAQGALENFGARERAMSGAQSFYSNQTAMRNALVSQLAGLRANRSFDPNQFRGGQSVTQGPVTRGLDLGYSPPPPIERRRTGTTVPNYSNRNYGVGTDYTGAWALGR